MYSCACSLSSNPIDLCTVMTYECWQTYGKTALLWASEGGHAETVRVLVELGKASVEAVDKVNIHAHALAHTCCIKHVSGIMRRTDTYTHGRGTSQGNFNFTTTGRTIFILQQLKRKLWQIADAFFRISSMTNSFQSSHFWKSLQFSTGPSKLFEFPGSMSRLPSVDGIRIYNM
jgi:hypothetical protein